MVSDDNTLSWTRPLAVARQCAFMCFGGAALERGLKRGAFFSSWILLKSSLLLLVAPKLPTPALTKACLDFMVF